DFSIVALKPDRFLLNFAGALASVPGVLAAETRRRGRRPALRLFGDHTALPERKHMQHCYTEANELSKASVRSQDTRPHRLVISNLIAPWRTAGGAPWKIRSHPHETGVFLSKSSAVLGNLEAHARAVPGSRGAGLDRVPLKRQSTFEW